MIFSKLGFLLLAASVFAQPALKLEVATIKPSPKARWKWW